MGKSQRIREERAHAIASNPEKHVKSGNKSSKKMSIALTITFAVLIVALIAIGTIFILRSTGTFTRMQIVAQSQNFKVDANMMFYYHSTVYTELYEQQSTLNQYFGSDSEIDTDKIYESAVRRSKEDIRILLALCEAAKKDGVELGIVENAQIDLAVENLNTQANYYSSLYGYTISIGDLIGSRDVKEIDVRNMAKIMMLAEKYSELKGEEFISDILADEEKLVEYVEKNMSSVYKSDYILYTVNTEEEAKSLALITDETEFKAQLIVYAVEKNFDTELGKLELDAEAPVASLAEALKNVIIEELKYSILGIKVDGLEFDEDSERLDRIKAIFEKLYGGKTFEKADGDKTDVVAISEILYNHAKKLADTLNTTANSTITSAVKTGISYNLADETNKEATPTDTDKWVFDSARKAGETTYIKVTKTSDGTETTTYNVVLMLKGLYRDEEMVRDIGHILIKTTLTEIKDTMTAEEKAKAEAKNAEILAEAKEKAEKLLADYLAGDKTKDSFEVLGMNNTEDSSVFIENVRPGQMTKEFNDWMFDANRKEGDTGIVKTTYGYHVMYYVGNETVSWKATAASHYASNQYEDWYTTVEDAGKTVTVNYDVISNIFGMEVAEETTAAETTTATPDISE